MRWSVGVLNSPRNSNHIVDKQFLKRITCLALLELKLKMMIPKPTKKKKINRKSIIAKLDKLTSEIVRLHGSCERCGKKETLQCAHIYSRSYKHLRWEMENLICLCSGCHFWWHQNPTEAVIWVMDIRNIELLKKIRQNITPIKTWELEALLKDKHGLFDTQLNNVGMETNL